MTLSKKLSFSLILLFVVWFAAECVAFAALSLTKRSLFSYRWVVTELTRTASTEENATTAVTRGELTWGDYVEVLHPYFGYVADPVANKPFWEVSDLGFVFSRESASVTRRSDDRLIVAVFGGSFANGQYQRLKALLESKAEHLNKRVEVLNLSLAGYKQPQQLMVLNYLMAVGAEFDVVVNIDGFNEVTLPSAENRPSGLNPYFPRGWDRRTATSIDQAELRKIGLIESVRYQRAKWAQTLLDTRLYVSPMACLVWSYNDKQWAKSTSQAQRDLAKGANKESTYTMHGPSYDYSDEQKFFDDLAGIWKNSSAQMDTLCKADGTRYLHFLQPNQYVADSKPMETVEEKMAINRSSPSVHGVLRGYPLLAESGAELQRAGVRFTDLRDVFKNVRQQVYVDDCCHLNGLGYDIIAKQIYEEITRE